MTYDHQLAQRIRETIGNRPDLTEKAMFGGLAFLINGHMSVAASGQSGLIVRVDPADSDQLVATTDATLMEMRGRTMAGWLRVATDSVATDSELKKWVAMGVDYAATLPPK